MAEIVPLPTQSTTLRNAVEAFFSDQDLSPATRRTYAATYRALQEIFSAETPVSELDRGRLHHWFKKRWGNSAPAIWNARLTAIQVLVSYCRQQRWLARDPAAGLERRRLPPLGSAPTQDATVVHAELPTYIGPRFEIHYLPLPAIGGHS